MSCADVYTAWIDTHRMSSGFAVRASSIHEAEQAAIRHWRSDPVYGERPWTRLIVRKNPSSRNSADARTAPR